MSYVLRQNPASENNYSVSRTQAIKKVFIHHAATTSFDGIARTFQNPNRQASAHYGVGANGNVDQYVQEKDTAWHAGTPDPATNPNPSSIGIENVNETGAPEWDIAESTFNTLVELVRDVATRNGLLPLVVGKNLFGHRDVAQTACPGDLYPRLQELADKVNGSVSPVQPPIVAPPVGADQIVTVGSKIEFRREYTVNALALIGGIWQIKTDALCPVGFTWNDNGIPAEPVVETSDPDQVLAVGSRYKIPGTYRVIGLGQYQGHWMAQINIKGWSLWFDIETVTEI